MPWFSYHGGHSGQFCRHAKGQLRDVVLAAMQAGFTHYGLSEHCPRYRPEDIFPGEEDLGVDGLVSQFQNYVVEARSLQSIFRGQIDIAVGFETERLPPGRWIETMKLLRGMGFDYVVGSVHDVDGVCIDYSQEQTDALAKEMGRGAMEVAYFEALSELVLAVKPDIVGHLDLVRKFSGALTDEGMKAAKETLAAVASVDAALDVNCGAARRGMGPVYPLPELLAEAKARGIAVTLGDDSHGPDTVGVGLDMCLQAIAKAGYTDLRYMERDGWRSCHLNSVAPS